MSRVVFVGAGPGDPELITVKGKKALERADVIIYAGSLVPQELLEWASPGTKLVDSASLTLEQVMDVYNEAHSREQTVVRLHSGDPGLYGAIQEQIDQLVDLGLEFEVVPGVTAAMAAAAAAGRELTMPEVSQTVIFTRMAGRTPVPEGQELSKLAAAGATICLYLSIGMIAEAVEALRAHYPADTPVIVGHKVSRPDERIYETDLADVERVVTEASIKSTAVVLIGPALRGPARRSKLYDGGFAHGWRTGR